MMIAAVGGLIFLGTQKLSIRKIGTLIVTWVPQQPSFCWFYNPMGSELASSVQPRYVLPLVIVFLMDLLVDAHHPRR